MKSPFSYQFIREPLARPDIELDGVLIPVRDLDEAVASRITLELRHRYEHLIEFASQVEETWRDWGTVPGGVTYSLEPWIKRVFSRIHCTALSNPSSMRKFRSTS